MKVFASIKDLCISWRYYEQSMSAEVFFFSLVIVIYYQVFTSLYLEGWQEGGKVWELLLQRFLLLLVLTANTHTHTGKHTNM